MKKRPIEPRAPRSKIKKLNWRLQENKLIPELRISGPWIPKSEFAETKYIEIIYGENYILILPYKN